MKIIMCDGSSKGNPGQSKIGLVIWERFANTSSARKVTPTKTISKSIGIATNNDAEWQAVIEAIKYANDKNMSDDVFIYSDSLLVVNQVNREWRIKDAKMCQYYEAFCRLLEECELRKQKVTVTWLPRQLTVLADRQT